ncbi:GtrA family protein [Clostridium pasteurianum]|uniref:Putative membrane protein n=1 Tax=Clostridium pasteurianum BC1 TaxID=86416 RepID=R4KHP6_CLOPA|nr:GtrA family protein [Clostridium pasteurianum]AGK99140.1 putative membrane protein [Clostridium pasteurianum BC1]
MENIYRKIKVKYFTEDNIEKIAYLFFGGLTTLVNTVSYWVLASQLKMNYMIATVIAWIAAVAFAFITNKIFVFKSYNKDLFSFLKEISSFLFFRIVTLFQELGTMFLLVQIVGINDIIAKVVSTVLVVIANYFASKLFIFKSN